MATANVRAKGQHKNKQERTKWIVYLHHLFHFVFQKECAGKFEQIIQFFFLFGPTVGVLMVSVKHRGHVLSITRTVKLKETLRFPHLFLSDVLQWF